MANKRAPSASIPGFEKIGTYHGIEEYRLKKNGLRVLYQYDDTAPVVGIMVTYLVGSRHEAVGHTGATHLLEHLMFKGSKNFPRKRGRSVMDTLEEKGALMNASTWLDRTNYYEVLPDEHAEFAIQLEADRMRHAILTEKDRAEEMPAVRSEFAMGENDPLETLDKHLWATAYMAHPYHHSTIGWQDDFEHVSIERLRDFYNTYYWPNNAVVTILGNINRKHALGLIKKHFSIHTPSPHPIPEPYTKEPMQLGKRFVEVRRTGTKNIFGLAYKVPEALHKDTPSLLALSSILADGKTSRLYKALIETRLCSHTQAIYMPFKDPSLLTLYATIRTGVGHEKVARVVNREVASIQQHGVTAKELKKVLANIQTEMAFARDGQYATLSALNEAIAAGSWHYFFDLPAALEHVTPQDVQRAAQQYLEETQSTTGYYRAKAS